MAEVRPQPDDLPLVAEDESIIRFVDPAHYTDRLEAAHLPIRAPTADDYGPSVFVASRVSADVADLEAADVRWKRYGFARLKVAELKDFGVVVRWTPMDCQLESVRAAHATLFGISRGNRDDLVELIEKRLERRPTQITAIAVVFTCKLCGADHTSVTADPRTGVAGLPPPITTSRDPVTQEWHFHCAPACVRAATAPF